MKDKTERTLNRINKGTTFFGLNAIHLMVVVGIVVFTALVNALTLFVTLPCAFILVKKANDAKKVNNPDFINGLINKLFHTPKTFTDTTNILNTLKNGKNSKR